MVHLDASLTECPAIETIEWRETDSDPWVDTTCDGSNAATCLAGSSVADAEHTYSLTVFYDEITGGSE